MSDWFIDLHSKGSIDTWIRRYRRHYNGTCCCYVTDSNGKTRGSGLDCEYSKLNGPQQTHIRDKSKNQA